jgi:hypothetical protein
LRELQDARVKEPVFSNDLANIEAEPQSLGPVFFCVDPSSGKRQRVREQRCHQFIDEWRYMVEQLGAGNRFLPQRRLDRLYPTVDELLPFSLQQFEERPGLSHWGSRSCALVATWSQTYGGAEETQAGMAFAPGPTVASG